jgi:hypothetical protein
MGIACLGWQVRKEWKIACNKTKCSYIKAELEEDFDGSFEAWDYTVGLSVYGI